MAPVCFYDIQMHLLSSIFCWSYDLVVTVLDFRVVVQGQGPGPRYGHVMDFVAQRYLVTVSGNDGEAQLSLFITTLMYFFII